MSFLDRLEQRFGRFAIPGLIRYVVALNALIYVLVRLNPSFLELLVLSPVDILHGQIWRLVTYVFIPQFGSFILPGWLSTAIYLMFTYWIGTELEGAWGSFRLNLYYFLGMFGITVAAFFFGADFANPLLNASLFFAFAHVFPDEVILVMYIIPAKVKWLAWISAAFLIVEFLGGNISFQAGLIVSLSNYFLFFGPEVLRNARTRQQVAERRRKFEATKVPEDLALHHCAVCNRTEITNPELDFRVSKDGQEYCREHLPRPVAAPL